LTNPQIGDEVYSSNGEVYHIRAFVPSAEGLGQPRWCFIQEGFPKEPRWFVELDSPIYWNELNHAISQVSIYDCDGKWCILAAAERLRFEGEGGE
jgi:hypothetical protein